MGFAGALQGQDGQLFLHSGRYVRDCDWERGQADGDGDAARWRRA